MDQVRINLRQFCKELIIDSTYSTCHILITRIAKTIHILIRVNNVSKAAKLKKIT